MFNKLKYKLAITFSVMSILGIGIAMLGFYYFQRINEIYDLTKSSNNAFGYYLQMKESEHDFLWRDILDEHFYSEDISPSHRRFDEYHILVREELDEIISLSNSKNILLNEELNFIIDQVIAYDSLFKQLVRLYKERGGENHGVIGRMREYALYLENHHLHFNKDNLFLIKRHERDYILLRDSVYLARFKEAVNAFYLDLVENNKLTTEEIMSLQSLFSQYNQSFKSLVRIEHEIGLLGNRGVLDKIDTQKKLIEQSFDRVYKRVSENEDKTLHQLYVQFCVTAGLMVLLGIIFSVYIANTLVYPLKKLQTHMQEVVKDNFESTKRLTSKSNDEISSLIDSFNLLLDKVQDGMHTINSKNTELNERNAKLEKSEAELKKNIDVRDKFLAILSHDMRSPINTLTGFVNLLKNFSENISPKEIKEFADNMNITLESVKELLDNLLQWAKLQTDNIVLKIENIDIQKELDENIRLVSTLSSVKNIKINYLLLPNTQLETDRNILNFVIRNVLQNAIKFTNTYGTIEIRVILGSEETTFLIRDNGVGMDAEMVRKLFDYKTHFSKEGTSKEKGAGLGLLLCKEFMEKLGGDITVDSELNVGTTFYIHFPKSKS